MFPKYKVINNTAATILLQDRVNNNKTVKFCNCPYLTFFVIITKIYTGEILWLMI